LLEILKKWLFVSKSSPFNNISLTIFFDLSGD
jgi:hypothetical protein